MSVDAVEAQPSTRMPRWLLPLVGFVAVLIAASAWFLRQPVLTEGSFQDFPGSQVPTSEVYQPLTYDQSVGGGITYTLTAMNSGSTTVTLISAAVQPPEPFSKSSVDLPAHVALAPGSEARLVVHATFAPCTPGQSPFTTPVPGVEVTFRQLGLQRTDVVSTSGNAVVKRC